MTKEDRFKKLGLPKMCKLSLEGKKTIRPRNSDKQGIIIAETGFLYKVVWDGAKNNKSFNIYSKDFIDIIQT